MNTLPKHASPRRAARLAASALVLTTLLLLLGAGCNQGAEGDRCNPDLSAGHDECGGGLKCTQPVSCPENYCCPASGPSSNPYCQAGCNGGLASICAANPSYDACAPAQTDAAPESGADSGASETGADSGPADAGGG